MYENMKMNSGLLSCMEQLNSVQPLGEFTSTRLYKSAAICFTNIKGVINCNIKEGIS